VKTLQGAKSTAAQPIMAPDASQARA